MAQANKFEDEEIKYIKNKSKSLEVLVEVKDFLDEAISEIGLTRAFSEEKKRKQLLTIWRDEIKQKIVRIRKTQERSNSIKAQVTAKTESAENRMSELLLKTMLKERKLEKIDTVSNAIIHADVEFNRSKPQTQEFSRRIQEKIQEGLSLVEAVKAVEKEDKTPVFTMPNFKAPESPELAEPINPVQAVRDAYGTGENGSDKPAISLLEQIANKDKEIFDGPLQTAENSIKID